MCPAAPNDLAEAPASERPLRRDAERNRQLILQAARERFAERGLSVTLDDIAKHAGVGVGTVYRRFPDRDSLVEALFQGIVEDLLVAARQAAVAEDPLEGLLGFLEYHLSLQVTDRGFEELMLNDTYGRQQILAMKEEVSPVIDGLVERAKAAGQLRADLETTDFPIIVAMLSSVVRGTRELAPDTWRRYLALILDGLRPVANGAPALPAPALDHEAIATVMRASCGAA
jgi:AcrR family transcriptional regulator